MSSSDKLSLYSKKTVETFMALNPKQQKDVLTKLIKWHGTDVMANDLRCAIHEVLRQ